LLLFLSYVVAMTAKDLSPELKKLEKSIREMEQVGSLYTTQTSLLTGNREKADAPLNGMQYGKLVKAYRDTRNLLSKLDKSFATCIDKVELLEGEKNPLKKRKRRTSSFLRPGRLVAAKISNMYESEEWILCSVVLSYEQGRGQMYYEVEDEDPGDEHDPNPVRKHFHLPAPCVIPLSSEAESEKPRDFKRNQTVLAMFPNTTTFYQAIIQGRKNEDYLVTFNDDEDDTGQTTTRLVENKYVISTEDNMGNVQH